VFAVIFSFFRVPPKYQYRVLFWGIMGAVIMRLTFILLGAGLIELFDWIMPIFGLFLVYTAVKLAFHDENDELDPSQNILMRIAKKLFPVAKGDHGERFFVREAGKLAITPLFLVLLVVESTDVLFAVDSVPAIFGITKDPFIVFTSNIFAILGLRALYFLLAGVMGMFRYLNYGLSAVLAFVGIKMVADYLFSPNATNDFIRVNLWAGVPRMKPGDHLISPGVSLVIVLSLLAISIIASLIAARFDPEPQEDPTHIPENAEVQIPKDEAGDAV
jgi:TerC family integral membrane protein